MDILGKIGLNEGGFPYNPTGDSFNLDSVIQIPTSLAVGTQVGQLYPLNVGFYPQCKEHMYESFSTILGLSNEGLGNSTISSNLILLNSLV